MAETINIVGEVDGKPLSTQDRTKVHDALKKSLHSELIPAVAGLTGSRHFSSTHISIVFS
jgi:hypothetical protein